MTDRDLLKTMALWIEEMAEAQKKIRKLRRALRKLYHCDCECFREKPSDLGGHKKLCPITIVDKALRKGKV